MNVFLRLNGEGVRSYWFCLNVFETTPYMVRLLSIFELLL